MTSLLLETDLTDEQRDYVNATRRSADALLEIVNDILDFSKIESGKMELEHQPFDLHNCIEEFEYSTREGHRERHLVHMSSDAGYWRDVGTIEALWSANLDLVAPHPSFNLYGEKWPIFNDAPHFPPAKFVHELPDRTGQAHNAIVADGVILSGCLVRNSILSPGTYVHSYSLIESSILFGGSISGGRVTETVIGRGCRIRNAVVDKNVSLSADTVIGYDRAEDEARGLSVHPINDGPGYIVVVPRGKRL